MIDPGAIPQVGGDLEAVAAAGGQLKVQGQAVSDTGADVHATWQRLAGVYVASETGELLAATGPVRVQTAAVGGRLMSAGAALVAYADEVRPIQAQLAGLRSSASEFVASVQGADDWRSDGRKVAEHNGLLSGVSSAVAAWMEAQRRCANAIAALDGGVQYVADNGDGTVGANEYGYTAEVLGAAAASKQGVPWGRSVERDRPWYEDVEHVVVSAGKGVFVDGVWDAAKGIGMMVNPWSDDFGASWAGLAKLGLALTPGMMALNETVGLPGLERGQLSRTLVATGKGLVEWDTWKNDPVRAFSATLTNVLLAGVGTKGAGAGLKAGSALRGAGAARLGAVTLPKLADLRTAVAAQLAKIPKIELPQLNPALAGTGGGPKPFHFDGEHPAPDAGRMHNEAMEPSTGRPGLSVAGSSRWSPTAHVKHGEVTPDGKRLKGYHLRPGGTDGRREVFEPETRRAGPHGTYAGRWHLTDAEGNVMKKPNGEELSKFSSFWPDNFTARDLDSALAEVYEDGLRRGTVDEEGFTGYWRDVEVQVWLDSDGRIVTAYPLLGYTP